MAQYGGYYNNVPPPPPPGASNQFAYAPAPASAFGPPHLDYDHAPPSPLVVSASPPLSRSGSRHRPRGHSRSESEYVVAPAGSERGAAYLVPAGTYGVHRSNSERGRVMVEERHGRRSKNYDYEPRRRVYLDDDGCSVYSTSSYGGDSRGPSRSRSRHRHHSRSPSWASGDSDDSRYRDSGRMTKYKPSPQEEALNEKLKQVQAQLEQVQVAAEKSQLKAREAELEAARNKEIERKVQEQMERERRKEEERQKKEKEQMEAEKARIAAAAKKLLEEQAAAANAAKAAEEAEKAKIQAALEADRAKYMAAQQGKKTYTRFSKAHLAKEALDERGIDYTEESDHFLVHRFVEKTEQQYLWARTKEIRAYYKQIEEAAAKAPMVRGPDGGYVKYVQIAGQPYPIAIPVTVQHMPGGGQTHKVDPIKLKWSDIFGSSRR